MSYDLIFIPRGAGQSWDDAIEAAEETEDPGPRIGDQAWRKIMDTARRLFGEINDNSTAEVRELDHDDSGLDLSAWTREASLSIPYWHTGDKARSYLSATFELARVIEQTTGLSGYDLQIDRPLDESPQFFDDVVDIYINTSASFTESPQG